MYLQEQSCIVDIQRYSQSMQNHHGAVFDKMMGIPFTTHNVGSKKQSKKHLLPSNQRQHSKHLSIGPSSFRLPTVSGLKSHESRNDSQSDINGSKGAGHNAVSSRSYPSLLQAQQSQQSALISPRSLIEKVADIDSQSVTTQIIHEPEPLLVDNRLRSFDTSSPYRTLPPPSIRQTPCVLSYPLHIDSPEQNLGSFQVKRRTSFDSEILPYGTQHSEALSVSRQLKTRLKDRFNGGMSFCYMRLPKDVQYNRGQVKRRNPQGMGPISRYLDGPRRIWRGTESAKDLERGLRAMDAEILLGFIKDQYPGMKAVVSRWLEKCVSGKECEWYVRRNDAWVDEEALEKNLDESLLDEFFGVGSMECLKDSEDTNKIKDKDNGNGNGSCTIEGTNGEAYEVDEMVLL